MRNFKDLLAWQKAHELALSVYRVTQGFPSDERFGLTSQLRRASASIASNLAEGCGRRGDRELLQFVHIAIGSANEVEYQLLLAHDLKYIDHTSASFADLAALAVEVRKMLYGLASVLNSGADSSKLGAGR